MSAAAPGVVVRLQVDGPRLLVTAAGLRSRAPRGAPGPVDVPLDLLVPPGPPPALRGALDVAGRAEVATAVVGGHVLRALMRWRAAAGTLGEGSGAPAAVFVDAAGAPGPPRAWERIVEAVLARGLPRALGVEDVVGPARVLRLAPGPPRRRPHFALPFDLLGVGPAADAALAPFLAGEWRDAAVRRFGLRATTLDDGLMLAERLAARLATYGTRRAVDVLVASAADAAAVRDAVRRRPLSERPRLLLFLGDAVADAVRPPPGCSALWLPAGTRAATAAAVERVLLAVVHDEPLHAAAGRAGKDGATAVALLESRPERLDDLRLSHAAATLREEALQLHATRPPTWVMGASLGAGHSAGLNIQEDQSPTPARVHSAYKMMAANFAARNASPHVARVHLAVRGVESVLRHTLNRPLTSGRTRGALGSLAHARRTLAVSRASLRPAVKHRRAIAPPRPAHGTSHHALHHDTPADHNERRVNVELLRPAPRVGEAAFVQEHESVRPRERLQLRVQIGRRSAHTLVAGHAPPIDPLLPEPDEDGHVLHVAAFGLDFGARPVMRRLVLPTNGPSEAVTFDVVAPARAGPARLRVAVYYDLPPEAAGQVHDPGAYHNHLVQSFLLASTVEPARARPRPAAQRLARKGERAIAERRGTRVTLEFSRTARFANLDAFRPRLLSLALNDDGTPGTHTIIAKRGGATQTVSFSEGQMAAVLDTVREQLTQATRDTQGFGGPRFGGPLPADRAGADARRRDFDAVVGRLARAGARLYRLLATRCSRPFLTALADVRARSDDVIQVVRLAPNYQFPWAVVYDQPLPDTDDDAAALPVCHGFERTRDDGTPYGPQDCLASCTRRRADGDVEATGVCPYGFWGMRHQIEQTLCVPSQDYDAVTTLAPMRAPSVRVVVGLEPGGPSDALVDLLRRTLGPGLVTAVEPPDDVLGVLRDGARRPAVLLVVGHLQLPATPKKGDFEAEPGVTLPGGHLLRAADVFDPTRDWPPWTAPSPLVVLACCEGAVASLDGLSDLVSAFAASRAAGVVGTETVVYEEFACRFGAALATAVVGGKTLGAAVLEFRRALLAENNPLGFVLTPYGDAELARAPAAALASNVFPTAAAT